MSGSPVKYWLLLVCLLAAVYGSFVAWRRNHGEGPSAALAHREKPVAQPAAATELKDTALTDFDLTDQSGEPFDSASLRGKIWIGSFFFTNCPGSCWRMNQALATIQHEKPTSDARFISISCDPDNDTPQALAKYAEHFKADPARWTFLTGDLRVARKLGDELKIDVVPRTHSDRAFLVDRKGQVRGRFRLTEPDQLGMLEKLLDVVEAEPPPDVPPVRDKQPAETGTVALPSGA